MDEDGIKEQCRNLSDRQIACFSLSCFGMLSFASREFLAEHKEIFSVWKKRNLPLNAEIFSIGFERLAKALEASTPYVSDIFFCDYYLNSYLNGDDEGSFDARVCYFINIPADLARLSDALLSGSNITEKQLGTLDPKILGPHLAIAAVRHILCYALFDENEPANHSDNEKFDSSACWARAERDLQYAIELARQDKFVQLGEQKWDYNFFGYPFDGTRGITGR